MTFTLGPNFTFGPQEAPSELNPQTSGERFTHDTVDRLLTMVDGYFEHGNDLAIIQIAEELEARLKYLDEDSPDYLETKLVCQHAMGLVDAGIASLQYEVVDADVEEL
jgi:hypothetical protein